MSHATASDLIERVGKDKKCYRFTRDNAYEFAIWFKSTTYFQVEEVRESEGRRKRVPNWGATRNASGWEHFFEGADRASGEPKIICTRCDTILAHPVKNGTTGMTEHPQSKGCEVISKARGFGQLTIPEGFIAGVLPEILPEMQTLIFFLQKMREKQELIAAGPIKLKPENFEHQLLRTVIACHWPISVVDKVEFLRLITCTGGKITKTISSSTLTRRILDHRDAVEEDIVNRLPPEPQKLAIVLDCWSAPRREGFIAIKAYWVTEEWEMAEALIGFEAVGGNHTGELLGQLTFDRLERFKISTRVIAITSDNASNNKTLAEALNKAIKWLSRKMVIQDITLMPCTSHVIQLGVNDLLVDLKIVAKQDAIKRNWEKEEEEKALAVARGETYRDQVYPVSEKNLVVFLVVLSTNLDDSFHIPSPKQGLLPSLSTEAKKDGTRLSECKKSLI